ncbi:tetratricopeptide repeat protein [Cytophagaceae bacterium ABcell3]|nr:tetratricopeptide repeat protein [Cytophagaceae bacterium ABcell3]
MKEVEHDMWEAHKDDYNRPLYVFPNLDTTLQKSLVPSTDYIIEKAALPVQKHKNSNWVDPSYLLIGQSRIFRGEFETAVQTFKYVNTKGKDVEHKQDALIWLIRTYIYSEELKLVPSVVDYLKKRKLTDDNKRNFHLTLGYYYQKLADSKEVLEEEDYDFVIAHLTRAVPFIKKRDERSRVHFILGQLNQFRGRPKEAHEHYQAVLKNNPPYELSFFARLYMTQVSDLSRAGDVQQVEKYFRKLLKDKKNVEYKDKIYYEMALFRLNQDNHKKAIEFFEKSLASSAGDQFQKARSYHQLGRLYYEDLQKYELAKAYYDSTVTLWDKKDREYKPIARRQEILAEFVRQLKTIEREDSLQRLAAMDSTKLSAFLDQIILDEEKKQREDMRRLEEAAKRQANAAAMQQQQGLGTGDGSGKWYFYNPANVNMGRMEFERKWGKRKLEDHWRRSMKEVNFDDDEEEEEEEEMFAEEVDSAAIRAQRKEELYKDIPFTQTQMDTSDHRLEQALYKLGKIYDLNLEEYENSIETFKRLIKKYPKSEHRPEVLYFLYLLHKEKESPEAEDYKNMILSEFPNSVFAKIIKNPNYLEESKALNKKVAKLFKQAYELYSQKEYFLSEKALNNIKDQYPESDIEDKIEFLLILIHGKTGSTLQFRNDLEAFIETYSNSTLLKKAEELMKTADDYLAQKEQDGDRPGGVEVKYINKLDKPHFFIAELPKDKIIKNKIMIQFRNFTDKSAQNGASKEINLLDLNDSTVAVVVRAFGSIEEGFNYMDDITSIHSFLNDYKPSYRIALITDDNYSLFEKSRDMDAYLRFYRAFYE